MNEESGGKKKWTLYFLPSFLAKVKVDNIFFFKKMIAWKEVFKDFYAFKSKNSKKKKSINSNQKHHESIRIKILIIKTSKFATVCINNSRPRDKCLLWNIWF